MRILIDARLYGLENAGLGRYVMNLIHELSILDSENEYSLLLRKKYFGQLTLPDNFKKVLADFKHYSFLEQLKLPNLIKREKADLVHFPHFNVPLFYKGRFVVTIHDLVMHWQKGKDASSLPAPIYYTKRLAYKTIFKKAVMNSTKIIVPSSRVKKEVYSYYKISPNKISVVYEGVSELKRTKLNATEVLSKYKLKTPYIIYTGNAYPHKNLEIVIKALVQLNKSARVNFAIVSSRNVFTSRLDRVIKKNNAQGFVKLLGFVPDDELSLLYQNSVAFIYPSLYEGFGLPVLEAISSGTISIVSDIPVFREIYKNYVLYFDPHNVDSIIKTIKRVLTFSQATKSTMVKKSQAFIKKYSWAKMAKETLSVYNSASKA